MKSTRTKIVGSIAAGLLLLSACGSDSDHGDRSDGTTAKQQPSTEAAFPITVKGTNGELTIDAEPKKIVVLAPSLTETVFAVGAGDQVVAVDDQSNYPDEAPKTDLSGYEPNIEAIGGYDPDLVILSDDNSDVIAGLKKIKVPVLQLAAATNLDETYQQIETIGDATGHSDAADDVVDEMKTEIKKLVGEVPAGEPITYFHELDNTYYTATSKSFIGELYTMAGFKNIADGADDGSGYPQLSVEYILEQDPQAIFLADTKCCGQNAAEVAKRPAWDKLTAVKEHHVFELDDDIASRWGPRVVDLLKELVDAHKQISGK